MIHRVEVGRSMVIAAAVAAAVACSDEAREPAPQPSEAESFDWPDHLKPLSPQFALGQDAPDFSLPTLTVDGVGEDTVRLSALAGHVVVLHFWNTDCAPCVAEHGTVNAIARQYHRRGVRYLGVNDRDTPATLAAFEEEHGPGSYPQLADEGDEAGRAFSKPGWPLHVVIDREGRVAWWRPGGPIREETLHEVIGAVLDGRRPRSPTPAGYDQDDPGSSK